MAARWLLHFWQPPVPPMATAELQSHAPTGYHWCEKWWDHPEAVNRIEALWRSWEEARQDPWRGMALWIRDQFDHHWPRSITHTLADLQDLTELPACDLLLACASLPFVPSNRFHPLWAARLGALQPGGVLAVDLFGDHDEWASDGTGTFLTAEQVRSLITGLEVLELREEEYDGRAFSGLKHWHTYQLVARKL